MKGDRLAIGDLERGDVLLLEDIISKGSHLAIAAAQAVVSHHRHAHSNVCHAGIYDPTDQALCEASGAAGLRRLPLARKHPGHQFQAYRYQGPKPGLGALVVEIANQFVMAKLERQFARAEAGVGAVFTEKGGGGSYTKKGCVVRGGLGSSRLGSGGKDALSYLNHSYLQGELDFRFYCSNFVVACYQLAELKAAGMSAPDHEDIERTITAIKLDYRNVSPKRLQGVFRKHKDAGLWLHPGSYFTSPDDYHPGAGSNLWTPDVFEEQTFFYSKRPAVLGEIKIMLENYHGIPDLESTRSKRATLLDTMLVKAIKACDDKACLDRKPAIDTLIDLIEQEMSEIETD